MRLGTQAGGARHRIDKCASVQACTTVRLADVDGLLIGTADARASSSNIWQRIGELMGALRDFDRIGPGESVQQLTTENTTLKDCVHQLTQEHRKLQERLEGAHSNLRFVDKRVADLEAQLLEQDQP